MPAQGYPQQAGAWPQQQAPYPQQPAQYQQATPQGAPAQQQTGSFQQAAPYMQAGLYQQAGFPQQYGYPANHPTAWDGASRQRPNRVFNNLVKSFPQFNSICLKLGKQGAAGGGRTVQNRGANEPFLTDVRPTSLDFLVANGQCGPTELTNAFGHSGPTWSRELATLSGYGFATKHGRKYFLTELGRHESPNTGLKTSQGPRTIGSRVAHGYRGEDSSSMTPSRSVNATSATGASSTFLDSAFPSNSPKRPSPSRPPRVSPTLISSSNAPS